MMSTDAMMHAVQPLLVMSEDDQNDLVAHLREQPPAISLREFSKGVAVAAGLDSDEWLLGLLETFSWVTSWSGNADLLRKFAVSVVEYAASGEEEATDQAKQIATNTLTSIFACQESFGVTNKAQSVLWSQGTIYQSAKVITQIRPLFLNDVSDPVNNAVIIHELFITTKRDDESEKLSGILLDSAQARALAQVLNRALEKEKSIRSDQKLNYLGESK